MLERKKLQFRNPVVSESRSFLVRYRRTYVLNNLFIMLAYLLSKEVRFRKQRLFKRNEFLKIEVIPHFWKSCILNNVRIYRKFYKNWFINDSVTENFAKIPSSRWYRITSPEVLLWDVEELTYVLWFCQGVSLQLPPSESAHISYWKRNVTNKTLVFYERCFNSHFIRNSNILTKELWFENS